MSDHEHDTDHQPRPDDEPAVLRSGRVRIVGAEPVTGQLDAAAIAAAAAGTGDEPDVASSAVDSGSGAGAGGPSERSDAPGDPELPHWTDAPTGEVPSVLSRGGADGPGGSDPWSSLPAPTWREEHTDWTAQEETFEPSMLGQDDQLHGSLAEPPPSDRQPWSFDLASGPEAAPEGPGPVPGTGSQDAPGSGAPGSGAPGSDAPGSGAPGSGAGGAGGRLPHDEDTMVLPAVRRALAPELPEEVAFRFDEAPGPGGGPVPRTTAAEPVATVGPVGGEVPGKTTTPSSGSPGASEAGERGEAERGERPAERGEPARGGVTGSDRMATGAVPPPSAPAPPAPPLPATPLPDRPTERFDPARPGAAAPASVVGHGDLPGDGLDGGHGEREWEDAPARRGARGRGRPRRRGRGYARGEELVTDPAGEEGPFLGDPTDTVVLGPPVGGTAPASHDVPDLGIGRDPGPGAVSDPSQVDAAPGSGAEPRGTVPRSGRRDGRPPDDRTSGAPRPRSGAPLSSPGPLGAPEREARTDRNMPVAVASGVVLGIVALIFFKLGTVTSLVIVTVVVLLAAVEAYAAFRRAGYRPVTLLGLVATVALMVATYDRGEEALPLVLVLLVAFTMLWHLARVETVAQPVRSVAATLLVFCWIGVFGSFAALLLNPALFPHRHGIAFLLGAVVTVVAYDVGALATGAWLGRRPLSEISPHKTWEGLIGGTIVAVVVAVVAVHLIHPWSLGAALSLGVVVAVVSPLGDLSESLVKRHLGLKDMGRILPGHGGILDRVDGLLFVLPATYYLVKAFHLG